MEPKMNVVLIGMPACGKSTIGVLLAKTIGYRFVDTDLLIQESENDRLQQLINRFGIQYFLEIEEQTICRLNEDKAVVATGGSVIYSDLAMQHLSKDGYVIYLKNSYDTIKSRLKNITTRGVAIKEGQSLFDLYHERAPLYEKYADEVLCTDDMSTEEALSELVRLLSKSMRCF